MLLPEYWDSASQFLRWSADNYHSEGRIKSSLQSLHDVSRQGRVIRISAQDISAQAAFNLGLVDSYLKDLSRYDLSTLVAGVYTMDAVQRRCAARAMLALANADELGEFLANEVTHKWLYVAYMGKTHWEKHGKSLNDPARPFNSSYDWRGHLPSRRCFDRNVKIVFGTLDGLHADVLNKLDVFLTDTGHVKLKTDDY